MLIEQKKKHCYLPNSVSDCSIRVYCFKQANTQYTCKVYTWRYLQLQTDRRNLVNYLMYCQRETPSADITWSTHHKHTCPLTTYTVLCCSSKCCSLDFLSIGSGSGPGWRRRTFVLSSLTWGWHNIIHDTMWMMTQHKTTWSGKVGKRYYTFRDIVYSETCVQCSQTMLSIFADREVSIWWLSLYKGNCSYLS